MSPSITVIVPVYNAEQYLDACIESILMQTYSDLECILVDDGSKDNSGIICDKYAVKDTRVKVIHQENGGEMAARAAGVRLSQGDYLYFVDSDDMIKSDTLEVMISYLENDVDIVVFETSINQTFIKDDYIIWLLNFHDWTVWGKLYRRNLFDEYVLTVPRYFKVGGDFLTQLRLLKNVQGKICLRSQYKYLYNTNNPNSIQISYRKSYEYEKNMILEVDRILKNGNLDIEVKRAYLTWRLMYLGGMIGLRYKIDYSAPWVVELLLDSSGIKLSIKERIIINAICRPIFRMVLIIEKTIRLWGRRILNRLRTKI